MKKTTYLWIALLQAIAIALYHYFFHEPWRDEVQPWLIARDTHGLFSLLQILRNEGHPPLLYLLLKGVSFGLSGKAALAVVTGLGFFSLSAGIYFFLLAYGISLGRSLLYALALATTYSASYEMGVIARGYGLGLGLILLAWSAWKTSRARVACFLFALATITSVLAALMVGALAIKLFIEEFSEHRFRRSGYLLFGLVPAALWFAFLLLPAADRGVPENLTDPLAFWELVRLALREAIGGDFFSLGLSRANDFLHHFGFPTHWWNVEYSPLAKTLAHWLIALTGGAAVLWTAGSPPLRRHFFAGALALAIGFCLFEFLFRFVYPPNYRHYLFLFFPLYLSLVAFWVKRAESHGGVMWLPVALLVLTLVTQTLASALAFSSDYTWYFSQSAIAEKLIPNLPSTVVVSPVDQTASPMALYLTQAQLVSPVAGGRTFSFVRWDKNRNHKPVPLDRLFAHHCEVAERTRGQVFFAAATTGWETHHVLKKIFSAPPVARTAVPSEAFSFYAVDCLHSPRILTQF